MQVLLYSSTYSPRLLYSCTYLLTELLGLPLSITLDEQTFKNFSGPKINYSPTAIGADEFQIEPVALLFQQNIQPQTIDCFAFEQQKAFFKTSDGDFAFDIFAASFYLISRYEEYLPHHKDAYGRYAHDNSIAFKEGFLQWPLVNIWVGYLATALQQKFPALQIKRPSFAFTPTYDIDIAYAYRHKGWWRNMGGFLKAPSLERCKVWCGLQKDPFDVYDWLHALHESFQLKPHYFFMVAEKNSRYDKHILPGKALEALIVQHAKKYALGIHPSWQTDGEEILVSKEVRRLSALAAQPVPSSRQHYLRFSLPEGYQTLLQVGITAEYSMGYGSINGFRASVASPFNWYDLANEKETSLRVHPFCFMDATALFKQKITPAEALEELLHYHAICKANNGTMVTIFHNHLLADNQAQTPWRHLYLRFLETIG